MAKRHARSLALWACYFCAVIATRFAVAGVVNRFDRGSLLLCDMNASTKSASSSRDVVFLFATAFAPGLELCIRSLRSTGAGCRIVLFVAPGFVESEVFASLVSELVVEVVRECGAGNRSLVPHMLRFEYELAWLNAHARDVARVLHTDSFDVFFQGDPFSHVSSGALRFVVEPHQMRSCGWNLAWMESCYGSDMTRFLRNKFIICSGSIAGGAAAYAQLVQLMIEQKEWKTCWRPSLDQPILNYLVWTGAVRRRGIRYELTGCDGGFFTVQWCVLEKKAKVNEHGQLVTEHGAVPSYVHQYNRLQDLSNRLYDMCRMPRQ